MANAGVAKGSTVEVCSEEPGFHGAWYVATLLDDQHKYSTPPSSTNKKSSNKKPTKKEIRCLVKYATLLKDDSLDDLLTEIVNPTCVRPLPPRNLRRNNVSYAMGEAAGDDFELYDVVDAYHREGWWIGVVKKVLTGARKYVVSFENPPEEVEFGRSQLRLHVDWVDGRWQFPPKKMPEDKLAERNVKRASESDGDARAGLITPSKGPRPTDVDSSTVGNQSSSVTKTRSRKTTEKSSEMMVGAVKDSDSSKRNKGSKGNTKVKSSVMEKRGSDDVHEDSTLNESETNEITTTPDVENPTDAPQLYSVTKSRAKKNSERSSETAGVLKASNPSPGSKGNTKDKASAMEKSNSNAVNQDSPLTEPETNKISTTPDADIPSVAPQPPSVMKSRTRKNSERSSETVSVVKASDPSPGGKGNAKAKESRSDAVHQDSALMEHETNQTTLETCEAENSQSPRKKRKVKPPKLPAKEPISLQQGGPEITVDLDEPLSQLSGLKRNFSSRPNHNGEPTSQPTVTNPGPEPGHHDEPPSQPTVTNPGPKPGHHDEPPSQSNVTSLDPSPDHHDEPVVTTTDYQQNWPFTKRSPIWATIAALEFYQTPQQRPHFTPLKKIKADHREGLAIAHVVTFGNLVQMLSSLQLTDPVDVINNSLEILADLETHGFEVGAIRGRLNKFLCLKSKVSQHTIKLKKIDEEFEKCNGERRVEDNEINEIEMKIKELQEKLVQKVAMKKVRDEEIMGLQSSMKLASEQISDCELAFKKLVSTPL